MTIKRSTGRSRMWVISRLILLAWALTKLCGCELKADAIKACGEACKDHGGVRVVTESVCRCEERKP